MDPIADLLLYAREELARWRQWFAEHPAAWDVVIGEGRLARVGDVVRHQVIVDQRYAQRLAGEPVSGYDAYGEMQGDALFALGDRALQRLAQWHAAATPADLGRTLVFETLSAGRLSGTVHTVLMHTLIHGIRHWAQIATSLRQHGLRQDWAHDFLMHRRLPV